MMENKPKVKKPFRMSLRLKLAFPIMIFASVMIVIFFQTTFQTVQSLVLERNESRLKAVAEVFAETVKVPLILKNQQVLLANIEWMAKRSDVKEVRVEDSEGVIVSGPSPTYDTSMVERNFMGVKRVSADTYAVAVPILAHDRRLGRVFILFFQLGLEEQLRKVYEERLLLAFIMALLLTLLTGLVTWLAIRPIFELKATVREILRGDLTARAPVHSYDEIQDLGEAFNEMVSRLARSLDNLRSRTEALEESEEKFRQIVENAGDIIFSLTPEGHMALLNQGFSGCPREEFMTRGLSLFIELHDKESRARFEESLKMVQEEKRPIINVVTTHLHRTNHTEIFYQTNLTPVIDHEGHVKLIQGVMRDVTELRRIELMKDSLIRDVAHELKTPTAKFEMVVNWFEKEIEKNQEVLKYKSIIGILKSNTDRLMRTITSILDLTKLESGMDRIVTTDLDLNDVLRQVIHDMEPICKQKKLMLESSLSKNPLSMKGDRDMLYRLFVNLIGNGLKFTEVGKIILQSHQTDGRIEVIVGDTGIGIEPQDLDIIFERFVQKTASSMGIGVGLTICRDIAALHQGKIWAQSEGIGKGAIFKVQFNQKA